MDKLSLLVLLALYCASTYAVDCTVANGYCPQSCVSSSCVCSPGWTQSTTCVYTPCLNNPRDCITIDSIPDADSSLRRDQTFDCFTTSRGFAQMGELWKTQERNPVWRWSIAQFAPYTVSSVVWRFNYCNSGGGVPIYLNALGVDSQWTDSSMNCWSTLQNVGAYPWGAAFAYFNTSASGWVAWIGGSIELTGRVQNLLSGGKTDLEFALTENINDNPYWAMKEQSGSLQSVLSTTVYYPPVYNPVGGNTQYSNSFEGSVNGWLASNFWYVANGSPFGGKGWLAPDVARRVETYVLYSPWIPIPRNNIRLKFRHYIWGSVGYFGGFMEYRTNNTDWVDGSSLYTAGGYTGTFFGNSVYGGRAGWTEMSGAASYSRSLTTIANLASFIGNSIQFRWITKTDGPYYQSVLGGWWIDDFSVETPCGNGIVDTDEGESCELGGFQCQSNCKCGTGYGISSPASVNCIPVCSPACVNGNCTSPNVCTCNAGWTGSTCTTPVCTFSCGNGACTAPDTCTCNSGWGGTYCNQSVCGDQIRVATEECDSSIGCDTNCKCRTPHFVANSGLCAISSSALTTRIDYTGANVTWTFASNNVKTSQGIYVVVYGAGGATTQGVAGGGGGAAFAHVDTTSLTYFTAFVAARGTVTAGGAGVGKGGNGGGGVNGWNGGGGGGSSGVWFPELSPDPIFIAAGGGGAGAGWTNGVGGSGGAGGGATGQVGANSADPQPGGGGATQTASGAGGCGFGAGGGCGAAGSGPFGNGGDAGGGDESGGGGGGAGYYGGGGGKRDTGGGGGGAGGGGGGSSWIANITAILTPFIRGGNRGNGYTEMSTLYGSASNNGAVWIIYFPLVSTTSPVTSGAVTSSPLTTSPLTTSPLTTSKLTTSPLTSAALTSAAITSSPLTTSPLTTSPITSSPLTTQAVTSGSVTSAALTTSPVTSSPVTSSPVTSSPVTTQGFTSGGFTSAALTTSPATSSPVTSSPVTSSPVTSSPVTSSEATSAAMTTSPATSSPVTTQALTSSPVTSSAVTSSPVTSSPASLTTGNRFTTGNSVASTTATPFTTGSQAPVTTGLDTPVTTGSQPESTTGEGVATTGEPTLEATTGEGNTENSSRVLIASFVFIFLISLL